MIFFTLTQQRGQHQQSAKNKPGCAINRPGCAINRPGWSQTHLATTEKQFILVGIAILVPYPFCKVITSHLEIGCQEMEHWHPSNGCHFAENIFDFIFLTGNLILLIKFHWSLLPMVHLTISQYWFRVWLGAYQAPSHNLNQWWPLWDSDLNKIRYQHTTVEPLWKGQGNLTKVAEFCPFPCTILYKSCLFYPSWQATSFERPPSWLAFIKGFHCSSYMDPRVTFFIVFKHQCQSAQHNAICKQVNISKYILVMAWSSKSCLT